LALSISVLNIQYGAIETLIERSSGSWVAMKLFGVSLRPCYYMFFCGALAQRVSGGIVLVCIHQSRTVLLL